MPLALGLCDFNQVIRCQTLRLRQHRSCDSDVIMTRKLPHDIGRRIVNRRQSSAEFNQCPQLDPGNQVPKNVVKHLDLRFIEPVCITQKQIGDPPEGFQTFLARPAF